MAIRTYIAYCGGKMGEDGYISPTKSNVSNITDGGGSSWKASGSTNNTDADAYIFEDYNGTTRLHVYKSPCSATMKCTYRNGSNVKLINDNTNIWRKVVGGKKVMTDYDNFNNPSSNNSKRLWNTASNPGTVEYSFLNDSSGDIPISSNTGMFEDCVNLTSCSLPGKMRIINNRTFSGCTSLTSYTENPDFIDTIGSNAFRGCTSLNTLTIGKYTYVANQAFWECTGATTIKWNNLSSTERRERSSGSTSNVLNHITEQSFYGCSSLKNTEFSDGTLTNLIKIPYGISYIDRNAFNNCSGMEHLDLNEVTYINNGGFNGCTSLITVKSFAKILSFNDYAFNNCSSLIGDENGILEIGTTGHGATVGQYAFRFCNSLQNVYLYGTQSGKVILSGGSFASCTGLTDIYVKGYVDIKANAFSGCSGVENIYFEKETSLPNNAFSGCTGLNYLHINSNIQVSIGTNTFNPSLANTLVVKLDYTKPQSGPYPDWVQYYEGNNWNSYQIVDINGVEIYARGR